MSGYAVGGKTNLCAIMIFLKFMQYPQKEKNMKTQLANCHGCGNHVITQINDIGEIQKLDGWVVMIGHAGDKSYSIGPVIVENNEICKANAIASLFAQLPEKKVDVPCSNITIMPTGPVTYIQQRDFGKVI